MIRQLLHSATSSISQQQRYQSQNMLNNILIQNPIEFINQIFNLICCIDKIDHILAYSFLKRLIQQSQKDKLLDLNPYMEKAYKYWYEQDMRRNTLNQQFQLQKENIINLHALFLSLHTSAKYRQQFIDVVPYKICQLCSKNDKNNLNFYLTFYGQVLKQLVRYRIGFINSKRAAMGSVMLLKVTTKFDPQNSLQASLWVDFSINFSRFNRWVPDKGFLINCFSNYQLTKSSLMSLLQFFSVNIRQTWLLDQYAKLMSCLAIQMVQIKKNLKSFQCKQVQTFLKCVKSLLYNFFTCDKAPTNQAETDIVEQFCSFDAFSMISSFVMTVIDYFSQNNENQVCGNLSQMIIEYGTQILRLYVNYLPEQVMEGYAKQFVSTYTDCENYEKILILLTSMPKFILSIFDYEQITQQLLTANIPLHENFQPVYVNFLTHIVETNQYLSMEMIQKIGSFFFGLINNRQNIVNLQSETLKYGENISEQKAKAIQRMSFALYGLSKLAKYKQFTYNTEGYFQMMQEKIFVLLKLTTNDFSILIESLNEIIKQQNSQWNHLICLKCMQMLGNIYSSKLRQSNAEYYQLEIQLYRIINKTFQLTNILDSIQQLLTTTNFIGQKSINQFKELKILVNICCLERKSAPVKEEIILLVQNILITINQLKWQRKLLIVHPLINHIVAQISGKLLFQEIFKTLQQTEQFLPQKTQEKNPFTKISIDSEQYAIVDYGPSKQLHLSCIKVLLELLLYEQQIENIYNVISRLKSQYLLCVWQALEILYPCKILPQLIPHVVQQRLQKIRTGHILDLLESIGLGDEPKFKVNSTPSWYQLYRNILREDSAVIDIVEQKVAKQQ